jgi:thymidylate synthase (FAD)
MQDPKNRQNSIPTDDYKLDSKWQELQKDIIRQTRYAYTWALEHGIAKEQARAVLPEGNTKSRMYVNGTLRSWIHYIELRGANGTQLEHMDIAHAVADVITKIFPLAGDYKGKEL